MSNCNVTYQKNKIRIWETKSIQNSFEDWETIFMIKIKLLFLHIYMKEQKGLGYTLQTNLRNTVSVGNKVYSIVHTE